MGLVLLVVAIVVLVLALRGMWELFEDFLEDGGEDD
jgi:hypothetical protein